MTAPDRLDRPPAYMSAATLARELDVSEETVYAMVRRGLLPKPIKLSAGCARYSWNDVQRALASMTPEHDATADPFLVGIKNVAAP
ncbi:helix-turn-helix transcriptional regulator [Oharaeibacter diazotrophicus]|uniref:HTH merR-type domain-containing protein n=1 Tax=Oharaeibacter diazotrophicus TaxID=1920512 RepID=A0A4R6RI99_9HYPH|nr:hypothetical protein [Oharaeibacter diazotrophicus]TDP85587.1 hypothetical protein EDD54_2442 [Oharaeibacter diazotrophicus]BBE74558.1 hypothetical protein OHA_1_04190 [Pleomorphomonas sp. SM30]GLS75743.1 hypothetical protein GCM10007904_10780 [Oharaeibacter diazotrophicus]